MRVSDEVDEVQVAVSMLGGAEVYKRKLIAS
jgi:hypothetical protein